jgi:hypothetical protein
MRKFILVLAEMQQMWRDHWRALTQATFGPMLLASGLATAMLIYFIKQPQDMRPGEGVAFGMLLLLADKPVVFLITLWIGVPGHRALLLGEYPRYFLPVPNRTNVRYIGQTCIVTLLSLVLIRLFFWLLHAMIVQINPTGPIPGGWLVMLVPLTFLFVILFVMLRMNMWLPAVALGAPVSLRRAWRQARGSSATLILLCLASLLVICAFTSTVAIVIYLGGPLFLGLATQIVSSWVQLVLGLLLLSAGYKHLVLPNIAPLPAPPSQGTT